MEVHFGTFELFDQRVYRQVPIRNSLIDPVNYSYHTLIFLANLDVGCETNPSAKIDNSKWHIPHFPFQIMKREA